MMNRRQPPSTPPKQRTARRARFSRQEKLILALVAVMGGTVVILAAYMALTVLPAPAGTPVVPLPAQITPSLPAAPETPLPESPAVGSLPAGCRQPGGPVVQAVVSRVLEDGALEVQIDQQAERVSYAGVALFSGVSAAETVRGLLADPPVVTLIGSATQRDTAGRLPRYVLSGQRLINLELVGQGLGTALLSGADLDCAGLFQQAELRARASGLGGWKPTPAPTRTFLPFVDISTQGACDCSVRYECSDFASHAQAQTCYNACNDYSSRLDDDRDGIACEELP